jgi:tripartite-type tricarboxylate transporter receptor subunit TctC
LTAVLDTLATANELAELPMSQSLKQTIITNNKPGAGTNIAADKNHRFTHCSFQPHTLELVHRTRCLHLM